MQNSLAYLGALALIATCWAPVRGADSPSCLDEDGNPVDWYIGYKFPIHDSIELYKSGYAYAYITSNMVLNAGPTDWVPPADMHPENISFLTRFKNLLLQYLGHPLKNTLSASKRRVTRNMARSSSSGGNQQQNYSDRTWTISSKLLTDPKSAVLRTLEIAYQQKPDQGSLSSVYYSDGPPVRKGQDEKKLKTNASRAHAKGVLLIDDQSGTGLWLTHSVPRFPPPRGEELKFHTNSRWYGQSFMCINFDIANSGKAIVDHLANMFPLVYDSHVRPKLAKMLPELTDLTGKGKRRKKGDDTKLSQKIITKSGQELYLFSKTAAFGEDIYSDWLDHAFKSTLYVETWRKGTGNPLNSTCPAHDYNVNNVQDMKVGEGGDKVTWSYTQDHSKWAISNSQDTGVVCITDLNRVQSQFKRGGGAVCLKCPFCWSVFSNTILDVEPCPIPVKV